MTIRAADDFDAIRLRMREIAADREMAAGVQRCRHCNQHLGTTHLSSCQYYGDVIEKECE